MAASRKTKVYLEIAPKRTFAMALDWPGWGRSGKTEDDALRALAGYAPRYAKVVRDCEIDFDPALAEHLDVIERVEGNRTTEFGAPASFVAADARRVAQADAERTAVLVQACWDALDAMAARSAVSLRKGPRGGGRDRDKMLDHVISAEAAYGRKIGVKHKPPAIDDKEAIAAMRADLLEVFGNASRGGPLQDKGWPAAYAARRVAWHATDHAWEMEDRQP
jgi:hypothetical protein